MNVAQAADSANERAARSRCDASKRISREVLEAAARVQARYTPPANLRSEQFESSAPTKTQG